MILIMSGCNNPNGDSVIAEGHTPLLKKPANFRFTSIRAVDTTVTLTWNRSQRADEYKFFMGTSANAITTEITTCNFQSRNCTLTGLTAGTVYYFKIDATNSIGTTTISPIGIAKSVGAFDFSANPVAADGSLTLAWSNSARATSYNVLFGESPNSYTNIRTNITSPYVLSGLENGLTYYARIVAVNNENGYALSTNEKSGQPFGPPSVPTGLTLAATPGQVVLDWNSISGATSYKIFQGTNPSSLSEIANNHPFSNYTVTGLTNGTTYYFAIKTYNGYDSSLSSISSVKAIDPFNVTSVTAGPSAQKLTVAWPSVTGADTFDIKYGTNSSNLNLTASNVTSPYILTGLTNGATYYVKIVAKNAVGEGTSLESSNTLSAMPVGSISAPTGLAAASTPGQVVVSWNVVAGASSYEVLKRISPASYTVVQTGVVGTSINDTSIVNGETYDYIVRSYNGFLSPDSAAVSTRPIANFSLTNVNSPTPTTLEATWDAVSGAVTYDIGYKTSSASTYTYINSVTSPKTLTGLSGNTTYDVVVRAKNAIGAGTSVLSTSYSVSTRTSAPSGLIATTSPGQVSLNWSDVTGATSYNVYRGTTSTVSSLTLLQSGVVTSDYVDSTVNDGETLYYAVSASNGTESDRSSPAVAARSIESFSISSISAASPTSIIINWPSTVAGAATFDIKYGTSPGSYPSTALNKTPPFTLTGLSSGTTYYVKVLAKNTVGSGSSQLSAEQSQITPLGPPTGLTASVGSAQISLSWNTSAGATSYKVYRKTTGTYALITTTASTSFSDTTVTDGVTHYYVVRSYNGAESIDSSEVSGQPITTFALTSVASVGPNSIEVDYPATTGAATYEVGYGTNGTTYTYVASTSSPHTLTGLSPNVLYYVVVRAKNTIGSTATQITPSMTATTSFGAPSSVAAVGSASKITVTWNSMAGVTKYIVLRGATNVVADMVAIDSNVLTNSYQDTTATEGETYYYAVKAFNGSTSPASSVAFAQAIEPFTISSTTPVTNSTITLSWASPAGGATYDVQWGITSGTYTGSATNVTSPYQLTGLLSNKTYYIIVKAKNAVGGGALVTSSESNQKTSTVAPINLTATANSPLYPSGRVALSWSAATGATTYNILRKSGSDPFSVINSSATGTTFLDTTVTDGVLYTYAVQGYNGSNSANSNEFSIKTIGDYSITSATPTSSTAATITWSAADGADNYDIRYGTSSGVYLTTATDVTSPYSLTGLTPNTRYYIIIKARNASGASVYFNSSEVNFISGTTTPSTLAATASTGQIALSWTATAGASSYRIYRGESSGVYTQVASNITGTSYTDTSIANGTQYYYVIRAYNGIESPNSNEVTAKSIAAFSSNPVATTSGTTGINVSWSAPTGSTAYDILYGTTSGGPYTTIAGITSPYSLTGLTPGQTYYIKIRAKDTTGSGSSVLSSQISQVTSLGAPSGLASSAAAGSVSLTWTNLSGATSYNIYRGTSSGTHTSLATSVTGTNYLDTTVATNGTQYFYTITANNGSESAKSNETTILPLPSFNITSITPINSSSIQIIWPTVAGASSYDIKYGTTSGSYMTTLSNQTSPKTLSGLSPGSTYYIIITANNSIGAGTSSDSNENSASTAFGAPSGLSATASPASVNLQWSSVSGASSYKILRGTTSGSEVQIATGISTNTYTDSPVSNGTTYFYTVQASDGITYSANSNEVSVKTISAFTFTSATVASSSSITLAWTSATGADSYEVLYGTASGSYTTPITGVSSGYTLSGLATGTTYYIAIRARNAVGAGATYTSSELTAKTSTAAPTTLVASAVGGAVSLTWSSVIGATNYSVYRATTSGGSYTLIGTSASASYSDTVATGTQYYYVVRANNGSESANSNEATVLPISSFSLASTSAPSTSSIIATWSAQPGASTYDILRGTSSASYGAPVTTVTSPYTFTGLTSGTTYYIIVRAKNAIGGGAITDSVESTQVTPIGAPSGLAASSTPGSVELSWSSVVSASSYKVYRSTTSGSSYTQIATVTAPTTSYSDTVSNGTTYYYVVKSFNGADSANSSEVSARAIANFSIGSTSSPSSSSITVNWSAPSGAASYIVRYGTATGSFPSALASTTSTTATITGLNAGTTYYIIVEAKNNVGTGTTVNSSESTQLTALGAPSGLVVSSTTLNQVGLNWTNIPAATKYLVYRKIGAGAMTLLDGNVTTNAFTDTTPTHGELHTYAVSAYNGSESAQSANVTITPISSFTLTAVTATSASQINVSWATATGATSYTIRYGLSPSSTTFSVSAGSATSYAITSLSPGTTYYFSVRATNSSVATSTSDELNATTAVGAPVISLTATPTVATITWSAVSGASSYNIYRSLTSGTGFAKISDSYVGTSFSDTGRTNGTTYYYKVTANNGIESAYSTEASIQPIESFSVISAVASSSSQIVVTRPTVVGASTYDILYSTTSGGPYTTVATAGVNPYTLSSLSAATTYFIKVRANNAVGSGTSFSTAESSATTSTAAPGSLAATITSGSVALTWSASAGATNYKVYRATSSGGYGTALTTVTSTNYTDTSVSNGSTYFYVVRANNGIESANSNEVSGLPMASFSLTSVTSASTTSLVATWPAVTGAGTYEIKWRTTSGSYGAAVTGLTSTSYTISALSSGSGYYVQVIARNTIGSGTTVTSAEYGPTFTPVAAPSGLAATGGAAQVALTWSTVTGATSGYNVYYSTTTGGPYTLAGTSATTAYTHTGLTNGTTYFYVVRSNNGSESANSTEVSKRPILLPVITMPTSPLSTSMTINWSASTGAATYDLKWGTSAGTYSTTIAGLTGTSQAITGLTAGQTIYVQIDAKNTVGGGTTVSSAEASGITNYLPVISSIADQTMASGSALSVPFTISDSNNLLSCSGAMSATSSNSTILQNAGVVFSGTAPNCTASITPQSGQSGSVNVSFTASDGIETASVSFALTITAQLCNSISWVNQPVGMNAGSVFAQAPKVILRNADGSTCASNEPVTISIVDGEIASIANATVTPSAGIATFSTASMTKSGVFTMKASQGTVDSPTSSTFTVSAQTGGALQLVWEHAPNTTPLNTTFSPNLTVRVADQYGNYTIPPSPKQIRIDLIDNNELATLGGSNAIMTNATTGQAIFSLTVNKLGTYRLSASASTYTTINSSPFNIVNTTAQNTVATVELLQAPLIVTANNCFPTCGSNGTGGRAALPLGGTVYTTSSSQLWDWKIVATNTSTTNDQDVNLYKLGVYWVKLTIPRNTLTPKVFYLSSLAGIPGSSTTVGTEVNKAIGGTVTVYNSTLIMRQTGASKSMVYIPLTQLDPTTAATGYFQASNTTYVDPNTQTYGKNVLTYRWDTSKIRRIDSARLIVSAQRSSSGAMAYVALYNKTTGTMIFEQAKNAQTETLWDTGDLSNTSLDFNPALLPSLGDIEVRFRTDNAAKPANIYKVGIQLVLNNIEDMVAIQNLAPNATISSSVSFTESRIISNKNLYGTATVNEFVNCKFKTDATGGVGQFVLKDHGTNTSGTPGTTVSSSNINVNNQTSFTRLEAGPIASTTTGNYLYLDYLLTSGSATVLNGCQYEARASY